MYGYIYRITDTKNGKMYIGQHKYEKPELDPTYHGSGRIIRQIYNKRPETLLEEIIFIAATEDELNYFENYFIEHLNTLFPNGYNLNTGGDKKAPSKETRRKMSKSLKGRQLTKEHKEKIRNAHKGKHQTEETKKKCSEANKGKHFSVKTEFKKGKHQTEETKRKISEALKGKNKGKTSWRKGKFKVPHEEIYNYYINNNLKISEIAKIFNCSKGIICKIIKYYKENKNI